MSAAKKRAGACSKTPDLRPPKLLEDNCSFALKQPCQHDTVVVEQMPLGHFHYAREICATCGAHRRWLPSPRTIARWQLNIARVEKLLACKELTQRETDFVESLIRLRGKLSPRQQEVLNKLVALHLKGGRPT